MIFKNKKLLITGFILLSVLTLIFLFHDTIRFENVKLAAIEGKRKSQNSNPLRKNHVVLTSIHMGTGRNNSLGLVLASPFSNKKQESQLWKYSTQIKSDFLLSVGEKQLKEWVEKRDFQSIRTTFRGIVNKYLDEPVSEVYISSFFYE